MADEKNIDSTILNVLSIKQHITIMSEKTKLPYITNKGECFVVESKAEAEGVMQKLPHTYLSDPHMMRQLEVLSEFWGYGIEAIFVKEKGSDYAKMELSEIKARGSRNAAYNHETCKVLNLLLETGEAEYLRTLSRLPFYAVASVSKRIPERSQSVRYVFAKTSDLKSYYVFFSTLSEFNEWNKSQNNGWSPLSTTFRDFATIRKDDNIVVNPLSQRLILQNYMLKKYM